MRSNDISAGGTISENLTPNGSGESPSLSWSGAPSETRAYAFIMDDANVKAVHWNFFTSNTALNELQRDVSNTSSLPSGIIEGLNYEGNEGYAGPNPPKGEKHTYNFCIYALNTLPESLNAQSSFSNDLFKERYADTIVATGCFSAYYGQEAQSSDTSTTTQASSKYKVVAPLRYLAENYATLSDKEIATYLKALNSDDTNTLGALYTSLATYLQYRGCLADGSLIGYHLESSYDVKPRAYTCEQNYYDIVQFMQLLQSLGDYKQGDEFQNVPSDAEKLIIVIKCDTGEIDAGSCALYNDIQAQTINNNSEFYKLLSDSTAENTKLLANQCTYDGEVLSNGALCVL